jgi:hypothetical protein
MLNITTPEVMESLRSPTLSFAEKTAIAANVMVGATNIPAEYMRALFEAAHLHTPFWPQIGLGSFASARGTVLAIIDYLEGKPVSPEKSFS